MIRLLLLLTFISAITANSLTISCSSCPGGLCLTYNGAGFDNYVVTIPVNTSCAVSFPLFPITYTFTCDGCDGGCSISQGNGISFCTSSTSGQALISALNQNLSSPHDWCNCSSSGLSTGALVGIIVGCVVLLLIIIIVIVCCIRKRREAKDPTNPETQPEKIVTA